MNSDMKLKGSEEEEDLGTASSKQGKEAINPSHPASGALRVEFQIPESNPES
jgi:hypothetical protein